MAYTGVELDAGTGGQTVATDRFGSKDYQLIKLVSGGEGVATEISNANPVPVSDAGGSLTVDNAGTFAVQAAQSGTWNVGTVTTVTTVASVTNVAGIVPTTTATSIAKAVDSVAGATDTGVALLVVRDDSLGTLTPADGDYTTLRVDSQGRLHTTQATNYAYGSAAGAVDAATPVAYIRDDALTTLSDADGDYVAGRTDSTGALWVRVSNGVDAIADDAAFTVGTTPVLPVGFLADDSSPDSVNEGDIGAARMSLDRKQYVISHQETSSIYQNGTARTPVFAAIDVAGSGDNTLVAAAGSGNKIRVHSCVLVSSGTVNVRFESGAGGTALSGQMNLVANTGFVLPFSPVGWFETAANTLLNLELSGAVSVDGSLVYSVVT
jgi:hypothetical protein